MGITFAAALLVSGVLSTPAPDDRLQLRAVGRFDPRLTRAVDPLADVPALTDELPFTVSVVRDLESACALLNVDPDLLRDRFRS